MNKVFLIGRLTQDPTASTIASGHSYCRFSIAVNRPYSRDGENRADFINIVTWDNLAQNCVKYLEKGSQVAVVGSIQTGSYERDGVKRQTFDIRADQVEFLSRSGGNQGGASAPAPSQEVDTLKEVNDADDDMPF
ncbi:MAG: single-stranded DNA-binding protein [Corallococcus sp.]|nr:single-stranded DNA-binding protein [Corallococcus sp.]MCM1358976.1 single-stranded DNA-binding protein [Corallococcus sp.]MCM1394965.1 single-stranded DNA-binding protein [Corallococcus sp.]